jgi:PKHD-type hydroxylase
MIHNDTFTRRRITPFYVWWKDAFTNVQLDHFENMCSKFDLYRGGVVKENGQTVDGSVRVSDIKFFERNDETSWIFDTYNNVIESINDQFYQFDLHGYNTIQYTVYNGNEQGKYDWHGDTVLGYELEPVMKMLDTRKLTLVMLLNDRNEFEGGDFQINTGQEKNPLTICMERGMIIAFPSFMLHRVTPVLSGVRKSIVIWVEGPKFR